MDLSMFFPFWKQLRPEQQAMLQNAATERRFAAGSTVHGGSGDCSGLILVLEGQLRAFLLTDDGKELTLYRLLSRDFCLFSASCMMKNIQFDVLVQAEQDTRAIQIPAPVYRELMDQSAAVANYTNELMAGRFSDVLWLMDQILSKKLDSRLAAFLLEEQSLRGSASLPLTHEQIAHHLGSAREVVTRLLRYFQGEGLVRLYRGGVELLDVGALQRLAADSLR